MRPARTRAACRIALVLLALVVAAASGGAAKPARKPDPIAAEYQAAKAAYEKLLQTRSARDRRDRWLACIDRLLAFQKAHPKHERADDAMFLAGKAYRGLYARSRAKDDLNTGIMTLRRLIQRYPKSNLADDAQFLIGEMYEKEKANRERAYVEYEKVVGAFPKGDMVAGARAAMKRLAAFAPAPESPPARTKQAAAPSVVEPEPMPAPEPPPALSPEGLAYVRGVEHYSSKDYTRIVIRADRKVVYRYDLLPADPEAGRPRRLYVDLVGTTAAPDLPVQVPVADGLLQQIRTGQFQADVCRVVLDIESIDRYTVFSLEEPFRVVIDVSGAAAADQPLEPGGEFNRIVIDAGHGGHDPGAVSRGRKEKALALAIAQRLRRRLSERLPVEVILTRDGDRFIPLEGRTALANKQKGDLFISVHLNASRNPDATGLETYYLSPTRDPEALALAAAENAVSASALADIEQYLELGDIAVRARVSESSILASTVHRTVLERLRATYGDVANRGVHRAPFYVLVGAQMPAILIEVGFITHREEGARLEDPRYQDLLADAIAEGIERYIDGYQG